MEDIEEAFIRKYIPIKNLKRNVKTDGLPMTSPMPSPMTSPMTSLMTSPVTFSTVSSLDRTEPLKSGLTYLFPMHPFSTP